MLNAKRKEEQPCGGATEPWLTLSTSSFHRGRTNPRDWAEIKMHNFATHSNRSRYSEIHEDTTESVGKCQLPTRGSLRNARYLGNMHGPCHVGSR
jgi:hypothetical protein